MREVSNIEKMREKYTIRVRCPVCGYQMPISYTKEAECEGVMISCKGRNCHAVFELKIKDGKQIR